MLLERVHHLDTSTGTGVAMERSYHCLIAKQSIVKNYQEQGFNSSVILAKYALCALSEQRRASRAHCLPVGFWRDS